jgi:hypothetical protein
MGWIVAAKYQLAAVELASGAVEPEAELVSIDKVLIIEDRREPHGRDFVDRNLLYKHE